MAAAALLKTARSLDQSGPETTAAKLERFHCDFYASEEVALRWMLKNTSGSSAEAETLRRWPLTWHILGCLFRRIPLFTLAKTLADRRFVAVLQQTALELGGRPKASESESESESENPRKRKKWQAVRFDLEALQKPRQRVLSAGALFGALRVLLGRLDEVKTASWSQGSLYASHDRIGAEQIKSFFCTSGTDAMTLLVPLLQVCRLALTTRDDGDKENKDDDDQAGWITTFSALWDLRLQSPTDAPAVALNMTLEGCSMLRELLAVPGAKGRQCWAAGLQRFLTNNMVLPARSAYLNHKDLHTLELACDKLKGHEVLLPVLFLLAVQAPRMVGGGGGGGAAAATSRDNERWLQVVFDAMQQPLLPAVQGRNSILARLLDLAAQHEASPARESLQAVCRRAAMASSKDEGRGTTDWGLVASVARCDADAFLVAPAGDQLLDDLLQDLATCRPTLAADRQSVSIFLVALARGSAKAHSLPAFIGRWCTGLSQSGDDNVWLDRAIRTAVADVLQTALTKTQLLELLDQLDGASAVCRLVVLDAVGAGIRLEEYEDAVGSRMAEAVVGADVSLVVSSSIRAIRWRLIRRSLGWLDPAAAMSLWMAVQKQLAKEETAMLGELTFEALVCAFAFWMALKNSSGTAEQDARNLTWALFGQFQGALAGLVDEADQTAVRLELTQRVAAHDDSSCFDFDSRAATLATYLAWMLCGSSRFVEYVFPFLALFPAMTDSSVLCYSEMTRSSKERSVVVLDLLLPWQSGAVLTLDDKAAGMMTERYIRQLEEASRPGGQQWLEATGGLLRTPASLLPRRLRERVMSALLPGEKPVRDQLHMSVEDAVVVLDLLIRVTRERMAGDMDLDRLVWLGMVVEATAASVALPSALGLMDRYRCIVVAVLQHSLGEAMFERVSFWVAADKASAVLRLILLQAVLLATANTPAASKLGVAPVERAREALAGLVVAVLRQALENSSSSTVQLLLAFDAILADDLPDMQPQLEQQGLASLAGPMQTMARRLCSQNDKVGWKWRALMARYLCNDDKSRRELRFPGLFVDERPEEDDGETIAWTAASVLVDSDLLQTYLVNETRSYSQESLLSYIQELVEDDKDKNKTSTSTVGQLLAIQHLLGRLLAQPGAASIRTDDGRFDLAVVHSRLAERLPRAASVTEARLLGQTLRALLLDDRAGAAAMGQWNVDGTLSAVALAVALDGRSDDSVRSSAGMFAVACRLVEAVLKRHRLRLEGRFHLVVATLQALLTRLLQNGGCVFWTPQATQFARLLELVCEPSTAAVATMTRRGPAGASLTAAAPVLHSATEAARRSAGQHMYLVLMAYVKLQIDGAVVVRDLRDALEPGLFSVLGVTSDETRRLLNDAVDPAGRALFRDLYRRWLQFGKWKGV
ncbi:hypothetical protein CMQ_4383 [Grosmannia clavigera kw1407]|uniref:Nucleolar 27S pre-rRNA processing Urb2/Npa2 C-terminal domain-containing protein n=1 Tax=Grosmannia clavigera (strain kw1407 / UAMH 11150) TaxID=655863 RepID=F0XUH1_GROCL|nr:uncharacterized protein CMQ_4383 [Grosmannia clavigera kw1407]EFW98531.1 hypothetical protein CMQ_4383 [Grosmannia clavigera kw1407]